MSYGIIRVYDFSCDYPGAGSGHCEASIESQQPELPGARAEISRQGWRTVGDKDYCLLHSAYVTRTGRVLTETDLDELAAEAERGYDVSDLTKAPAPQRRRVTEAIERGHV